MSEDMEDVKNDVWVRLPQLTGEELGSMCAGLKLTVPEAKQKTKSVLYSLVLQQLMSASVEGMSEQAEGELFQNIKALIDQIFKIREIKAEQERSAGDEAVDEDVSGTSVRALNNENDPGTVDSSNSSLLNDVQNLGGRNVPPSNMGQSTSGAVTPSLSQRFANFTVSQSQYLSLADNLGRRVPDVLRLKREFRIDGTAGKGGKDSLL